MFRINVSNWQGDDSALQITDGQVVLQSSGKIEDSFNTKWGAEEVMSHIPKTKTYVLSVEEVVNV